MTFFDGMLAGFVDIFKVPFSSVDILWLLIPLFLLWITLEVYFARYKKEKLGWNTALANGITLGWITLEGMRQLFTSMPGEFWTRFTANMVILSYAFMIIYLSFTHKIKGKWDFILASPTPVYYLSIFSVAWGFGALDVNRFVLVDLVILFIVVSLFLKIARRFVKPAKEEGEMEMPKEPGMEGGFPPLGEAGGGLGDLPSMEGPGEGLGKMPKF